MLALRSDVVHIEAGHAWDSEDGLSEQLAGFKGHGPESSLNEALTPEEASLKQVVLGGTDESIFMGEVSVLGVLEVWVNPTIANGYSLEVYWKVL